jgi:hypothetical protein
MEVVSCCLCCLTPFRKQKLDFFFCLKLVGGWADVGVDPAHYSQSLATNTLKYLETKEDDQSRGFALRQLLLFVRKHSF